jgi:phosphoglucosamine mutase
VSRKYFGTDGIRGRVGVAPITPDFMLKLGFAAGCVLTQTHNNGDRPRVMIGKDTRVSGYMLESALEAGLSAAGVDVLLVGPMPTPGVAYLTLALRLQAGIMISASHNPFDDNGIKFFSAQGTKLSDAIEHEIEALLDQPLICHESATLGRASRLDDAAGRYSEFCKSTFPSTLNLKGLKLVVDCAHGATYHIAPAVFRELGAEVVAIGHQPDGMNINAGFGATAPQAMQAAVREHHADMGIALDGDGDRLVMADAKGALYDGDQLLYAIVKQAAAQNAAQLASVAGAKPVAQRAAQTGITSGVVGTLMTNLAVEKAFKKLNVPFVRAAVGDRYVLEALVERNWLWGGENSGHIICLDKHTTGDGIVSALQVLAALRMQKATLEDYTRELTLYPQLLVNVKTPAGFNLEKASAVWEAVRQAEAALAGAGRVLLRPSGTEPLIRVMVEGEDAALVRHWADTIAATIK